MLLFDTMSWNKTNNLRDDNNDKDQTEPPVHPDGVR